MSEPRPRETDRALADVERCAREYARFTHANLGDAARYRAREEARERLRDALARLDRARGLD